MLAIIRCQKRQRRARTADKESPQSALAKYPIRAYVQAILEANKSAPDPMSAEDLRAWEEWALAQADRIDPVKSGAYKTFPETEK